jgi:SpoVK/Ycf46/Vps4 family AAA+-type ATPase
VTVVAATNHSEQTDQARLRARLFDEVLEVGLPDESERVDMLQIHTGDRPAAESVMLPVNFEYRPERSRETTVSVDTPTTESASPTTSYSHPVYSKSSWV